MEIAGRTLLARLPQRRRLGRHDAARGSSLTRARPSAFATLPARSRPWARARWRLALAAMGAAWLFVEAPSTRGSSRATARALRTAAPSMAQHATGRATGHACWASASLLASDYEAFRRRPSPAGGLTVARLQRGRAERSARDAIRLTSHAEAPTADATICKQRASAQAQRRRRRSGALAALGFHDGARASRAAARAACGRPRARELLRASLQAQTQAQAQLGAARRCSRRAATDKMRDEIAPRHSCRHELRRHTARTTVPERVQHAAAASGAAGSSTASHLLWQFAGAANAGCDDGAALARARRPRQDGLSAPTPMMPAARRARWAGRELDGGLGAGFGPDAHTSDEFGGCTRRALLRSAAPDSCIGRWPAGRRTTSKRPCAAAAAFGMGADGPRAAWGRRRARHERRPAADTPRRSP